MLELSNIQKHAFNKLINNNSFIFWPRQCGKSLLLVKYIEYIVKNKSHEEIIYIGYNQYNSELFKDKLRFYTPDIIEKYRKKELILKNYNYISFYSNESTNLEYLITCIRPTIIIFEDFNRDEYKLYNTLPLLQYLKCKIILTSEYINFDLIRKLDFNNDYYINIIPQYKEFWLHDKNSNCYDFEKLVKENLYYKPTQLLNFDNIVFQRNKKLKILNKIANGK